MPAILRTGTPMADWRSFKFTHNVLEITLTEGQLYLIQDTCGVLLLPIQYSAAGCKEAKTIAYDADDPLEGVLFYHAEKIMVDKWVGAGRTFLPGDKVYWSGTQGDGVTPADQSGYYWIGICVRAAGASDAQVMIDLKGDKISITDPL